MRVYDEVFYCERLGSSNNPNFEAVQAAPEGVQMVTIKKSEGSNHLNPRLYGRQEGGISLFGISKKQ